MSLIITMSQSINVPHNHTTPVNIIVRSNQFSQIISVSDHLYL